MSGVVVLTIDRPRGQVVVSGRDLVDLADVAGLAYRTTGSGAIVLTLDALGDLEAAAAIRRRPIRIQSRRTATG